MRPPGRAAGPARAGLAAGLDGAGGLPGVVLAQEVADPIVALDADSAAVAGHDWGGGLAWLLAMQHPERIQRLVILNAPHPLRFLKAWAAPASCGAAGTCSPSSSPGCPNGSW